MAAVAPRPPSPRASSPSSPFDSAANFDLPAAELAEGDLAGALAGEGGASSAGSATLDVRTNFDGPGPAGGLGADVGASLEATQEVTTDESRQTGADSPDFEADDDAFSHFGDVAQIAAKAMESVDMERLCADLFAQEALAGEALGAVATQADTHSNGGAGVVSPATQAQRQGHDAPAKGSVPSTIAVPSQTTAALLSPQARENKIAPPVGTSAPHAQSKAPAVPTKPALLPKSQPFLSHQAGAQGPMQPAMHSFAPSDSHAQFSSPRNGFEVPEAKRQRFDGNVAAAAPYGQGGPGYSLPAQVDMHINQAARASHQFLQGRVPSPQFPSPTPQASPASLAQASNPQTTAKQDEVVCARCHFPGADVQIRCGRGCAYHARCLDLAALCRDVRNHTAQPSSIGHGAPSGARSVQPHEAGREVCVRSCPHCAGPAGGMEVLPLAFGEMDRAQETARDAFLHSGLVDPASLGSGSKRQPSVGSLNGSLGENLHPGLLGLPTAIPSHAGAQPPRRAVPCYDPSRPRTGRWTDAELAFRDALIAHFLAGALPLSEGLKLNDFLPNMLKSKQSRLAKKMKHAKLSTRYFRPQGGCVGNMDAARELSKLEQEFVSGVPDPVERSEIAFHMAREWRDHLARRLASLGVQFDGRRWNASAEEAERRLALATERHRLAKRRFLMGKAMATDADPAAREEGVFVSREAKDGFELAVERSVANSAGAHTTSTQAGTPVINAAGKEKETARWSSSEPNFRHAAPFLAGIASYVERNGAPFEHIDVWVPSQGDDASRGRLCHGGSATMGVQVVPIEPPVGTSMTNGTASPALASPSPSSAGTMRREPLPQEDRRSLSLFGEHSAQFSFAPGAGLPGRVFQSGLPSWARQIADAPAGRFERRGGAAQFGVRTAAAVPVDSPTVGRVVVGLYSRHDRVRDEGLLARLAADLRLLSPCPRWKLVVDVDGAGSGGDGSQRPPSPVPSSTTTAATTRQTSLGSCQSAATASTFAQVDSAPSPKDTQIRALVLLLGETLPSDPHSPLGRQLRGLLSLRLLLLRGNRRTPEEDRLVDTVLVLFESYAAAGRRRADIAVMVARDFDFHLRMERKLAATYGAPPAGPASSPAVPAPPSMYASQVALAHAVAAGCGARPAMAYHAAHRRCAGRGSAGAASPRSAGSR